MSGVDSDSANVWDLLVLLVHQVSHFSVSENVSSYQQLVETWLSDVIPAPQCSA